MASIGVFSLTAITSGFFMPIIRDSKNIYMYVYKLFSILCGSLRALFKGSFGRAVIVIFSCKNFIVRIYQINI